MHRIRDSLALSRVAKPAFCAVLISLFAFAAHAEEISGSEIVNGGGTVSFTGVSATNWVDGSLILIYTNPAAASSFTFPEGRTKARILAVGGGGGGGGSYNKSGAPAAGGGGSGGIVDTNALFGAGLYVVDVGVGGQGAQRSSAASGASDGGDGGDTSVKLDGLDVVAASGGGGGKKAGDDTGGAGGTPGGAAGGAAGYEGAAGTESNITGDYVTYAAGGNGGGVDATPVAGDPGTGNGGGGANSRKNDAANGGDGAVIVRIESSWAGGSAEVTGATVSYVGQVSTNWIGGELLLTFSGGGGFELPGTTIARILAVGGGGGGGGSYNKSGAPAAGGGGSGGIVDTNALFGAGLYVVDVGVGGQGAQRSSAASGASDGGDGGDTSVKLDGLDVVAASGGGGGKKAGDDTGGAGGTPGGAAGGAAGYEGAAGTESNITGDYVTYAAGGNGGGVDATPVAGDPGTGNGGGGANSRKNDAANGGDGVVIVRISATMDGELRAPTNPDDITFDGNAHTSVVSTLFYEVRGDNVGTTVGVYTATATLTDERLRWTDKTGADATNPVQVVMTIVPVEVTFSNLRIRDWPYGTPAESTPSPQCDVLPSWVIPVYEYADSIGAETWSSEKPTAAGTHYVRVRAPNNRDYSYEPKYAAFNIINGPGGQFTDYVELTIAAHSGAPLDNFPYLVTLSEKESQNGQTQPGGTAYGVDDLVGFIYERAGRNGDDMAFTDMDGNVLLYKVKEWNPGGESKVYVKIPQIGTEPQKIMLYWHLRDGENAPEHYPDMVSTNAAAGQPDCAFGLVSKDGKAINYFTQLPTMDPTSWNVGGTQGVITDALLATGSVSMAVMNSFGEKQPGYPPEKPGAYRAVFSPHDPDGEYEELAYGIDFSIIAGDTGTNDLSGGLTGEFKLTENGRVMLVNDDVGDAGHPTVKGQAYWRTSDNSPKTYWKHWDSSEKYVTQYNATIFGGKTMHSLNVVGDDGTERVLWRLYNAGIGNGFMSGSTTAGQLQSSRCALPWSSTSLPSTYDDSSVQGDNKESANVVLRNMEGAVVYSPCYTNGIGTIYFDAVNNNAITGNYQPSHHRIVVEVATTTEDGAEPTDENADWSGGTEPSKIPDGLWKPYAMLPLKYDGTSFSACDTTKDLALDIATQHTWENFYRICVKVEVRSSVRFRIRRVSNTPETVARTDNGGLILLDNIIVSYPSCSADMKPFGKYDDKRGGTQTLGQECAMENVPFPSVSDAANLIGRGALTNYVGAGFPDADAASFVTGAKMLYRWRYLNQRNFPEDGSWNSVTLSPFSNPTVGNYSASTPLVIPSEPGDVEFLYELKTSMPYYKYTDYSGLGIDLGGLYTEERKSVTNRMASASRLATCGTDWFVRLREGASDWEGVSVVLSGGGGFGVGSKTEMELVSDHTWRGIVQVPSGASGTAEFHFVGTNHQAVGSAEFAENRMRWYPKSDIEKLPGRGETMADYGNEGRFPSDTASRYLEFMFNDETLVYSVGHAEYQDFNGWHDAFREDGKFVGTYAETSGVAAASMVRTNTDISAWTPLHVTNDDWNATFDLYPNYDTPAFPKNEFFSGHDMPGYRWYGESGMFVDANLVASNTATHQTESGISWQMKGEGVGSVYYTKPDGPSGLDTVTFQARMSQSISFDDFPYWHGDGAFTTNNYTLVVPALLSYATNPKDVNTRDYAPGASMSVVGYYTPWNGCYEARVERNSSNGIQISIYKWSYGGYNVTVKSLASFWFDGAEFENDDGESHPNTYAILLSLGQDDAGKTTIVAGLAKNSANPTTANTYDNVKYRVVCVQDGESDRHTQGSYGVLSSNCNGLFYYPRQYSSRISKSKFSGFSGAAKAYPDQTIKLEGVVDLPKCSARINETNWKNDWRYRTARVDRFDSTGYQGVSKYSGLRQPTNFTQTVGVYLKKRGEDNSKWALIKDVKVPGYDFKTVTAAVHTNMDCDVKLVSGTQSVDVTVWDISQSAWSGEDIDDIGNKTYDFVYTQANVEDVPVSEVGEETVRCATLQPARALPQKALSVRSPLLTNGLGMVAFSFLTNSVREGCEVWVQAATNAVRGSLAGTTGYNFTTNEVALGESEPFGSWITLRKYSYEELINANGYVAYYCGWHSSKSKLLEGVFRIAVSPNVVVEAQGKALSNPEWGSISITGMEVQDEPALDDTSWIGWNLRTLGDASDGEKRMFLPDITLGGTASGLSSALNNSATEDIAGDTPGIEPAIQSPTFGGEASIGSVRFRARLYETNAVIASLTNATVTLYGSADGSAGNWGDPLTNFTVESTVYRIFEYSTSGDGYKAVKFEIKGVKGGTYHGGRLLLDEVVVSERAKSSVSFVYARPFREGLNSDRVIGNILSPDQQPLTGESWGVQAKVTYDVLGGDIDADRGFKVFFRYFRGVKPWGYEGGWDSASGASERVELKQVGNDSDLVFRSSISKPGTVVGATSDANSVVQYWLEVEYYMKDKPDVQTKSIKQGTIDDTVDGNGWTNPAWYEPLDYNTNQYYGAGTKFSPYTILDPVSPRRVWINEVNYNDGSVSDSYATNQFIELAVPWDVDLTGWSIVLTDKNLRSTTLATLGRRGIPSIKNTGNRSGDYGFLVLQSPATKANGGIRDETGAEVADGTWPSTTLTGNTLKSGTLQYSMPYQLELYRPSGIVEHQFVVEGTNTLRESWPEYALPFDGTNLVNDLNNTDPSAKRFFAGSENDRKSDGVTYSSLGVAGSAHGEDDGWSAEMRFTPGRQNEGQDELSGWYLHPLGATLFVYARNMGPHIHQRADDEAGDDIRIVMNSGGSTNILYTIDPWYAISNLTVWTEGGETNYFAMGETGSYAHFLYNVTQTTYVVASETYDPQLIDAGLDPNDRYTPAIMNWLSARHAAGTLKNPDGPISLGHHKELGESATEYEMDLKAMYWFDLDPTDPGWWLRHGIVNASGDVLFRKKVWQSGYTEYLTNRLVTVKMYLSNDVSKVEYSPYRLQGLGNEQSDMFTGNWTSETYKVLGRPSLMRTAEPLRIFVFGMDSFHDGTHEAQVEILDPFSRSSPGMLYGWGDEAPGSFFFQATLNEPMSTGVSVETLKADSSLPNPPYQPWLPE